MSNLTLTERLKKLDDLDSTIPENARNASKTYTLKGSGEIIFHKGSYNRKWVRDNIKILDELISGIQVQITMQRNERSVRYSGSREIKQVSYENGYFILEFLEEDKLGFELPCALEGKLILCGSNPYDYVPDTIIDPISGKLVSPKDNLQIMDYHKPKPQDMSHLKNSIYFESDGFLKVKFINPDEL